MRRGTGLLLHAQLNRRWRIDTLHRPRLIALLALLALTLVTGPILGSVALAADPIVVVQSGDTLTSIAKRHDVEIGTLVKLNGLANPDRIYAGQRLRMTASATPPTAAPPPAPKAAAARVHAVRSGEHLTGIARRYGVSIASISQANGISNPSRIYAGQRLTIPGTAPAAPAAAAQSVPGSMAALVAKRSGVRALILEEAARFGIPGPFALAVAWQESGWQQGVVSHAGAVGVMQLMPATAEWVGDAMLGSSVNIHDARANVRAGVRLLAHYLDRYDGDRARTLAAYYQGQWATDHHGIYAVSRPYIASIVELERIFGG
ncbi:MAG: LysM peptidoglycan-binding domain-containing protein [Candidatus Limnocylindria bacterium]